MPLLALYGGDLRAPGDRSLLELQVAAEGEPPGRFSTEHIVRQMVRMLARTLLTTGCALERHGQNTLVASAPDGRRLDIVYRNCQIQHRPRHPGPQQPARPAGACFRHHPRDAPFPAGIVSSLTYDSFMGSALDRLAALTSDRLDIPRGRTCSR